MFVKKHRYWLIALFLCLIAAAGIFSQSNSDATEFKWLIEPQFSRANNFYNGVAWVQKEYGGPWTLIDKQGNILASNFQRDIFHYSLFESEAGRIEFLNDAGLTGYMNLSGDIVISPDYQLVARFQDGLAAAKKNGLSGIINHYGETVLPFAYESLWVANSNMFAMKKGGKWGFVNEKGETVIEFIFDGASGQPWPDIYSVRLNGKSGLIDKKGEWILPASYDQFYTPIQYRPNQAPELLGVVKDGKVGYVDSQGNLVIDFQFEDTKGQLSYYYHFSEGLATVILPSESGEESKLGVIDGTGKVLFELPGIPTGWYSEGYMLLRKPDNRYGLIDREGAWHPLPLDIGGAVIRDAISARVSDGVLKISKGTLYGYMDIRKSGR